MSNAIVHKKNSPFNLPLPFAPIRLRNDASCSNVSRYVFHSESCRWVPRESLHPPCADVKVEGSVDKSSASPLASDSIFPRQRHSWRMQRLLNGGLLFKEYMKNTGASQRKCSAWRTLLAADLLESPLNVCSYEFRPIKRRLVIGWHIYNFFKYSV